MRDAKVEVSSGVDGTHVRWVAGSFLLSGAIEIRWRALGAPKRVLPLAAATHADDTGTRVQHFLRLEERAPSSLVSNPRLGTWWVDGAVRDKWYQLGAVLGVLGLPLEDARSSPDGRARIQRFGRASDAASGAIIEHADHGTFEIHGAIHAAWAARGHERGIGYPECDVLSCGDGVGWFGQFVSTTRSRLYYREHNGIGWLRGAILDAWCQLGATRSSLGYPVGDETEGASGERCMLFERGRITETAQGELRVFAERPSSM